MELGMFWKKISNSVWGRFWIDVALWLAAYSFVAIWLDEIIKSIAPIFINLKTV